MWLCSAWIEHLRDKLFTMVIHDTDRIQEIKPPGQSPSDLASCHTAFIKSGKGSESYVIEATCPPPISVACSPKRRGKGP